MCLISSAMAHPLPLGSIITSRSEVQKMCQLSDGKSVPLLMDGFEVKLNKINVFSGERFAGESGFIVRSF